jgi:hypothetical protein
MKNLKYNGKTIEEWNKELENVEGLDENGNPKWWNVQANLEDAIIFNKLLIKPIKHYYEKT